MRPFYACLMVLAGCWMTFATVATLEAQDKKAVAQEDNAPPPPIEVEVNLKGWSSDYVASYLRAAGNKQLMLLWFTSDSPTEMERALETELAGAALQPSLAALEKVRVTKSTAVEIGGRKIGLFQHPAFQALGGKTGMVLLDLRDAKSPDYGWVIRAVPQSDSASLSGEKLKSLVSNPPPVRVSPSIALDDSWPSDYSASYIKARETGKKLLVWFSSDAITADETRFGTDSFSDVAVATSLANYERVRIPKSSPVDVGGQSIRLLEKQAFAEMLGMPGVAIIDLTKSAGEHYGHVVSVYPFRSGRPMEVTKLRALMNLPTGSLTQRTLVFAVRTHPEAPQSTNGNVDPMLMTEALKHASCQAVRRVQGHHDWNTRFQCICAQLPPGLKAQEVCAESWPGERLVEAAEECVDSWRQSSGHWSAVSSFQPLYGYDMRRGTNGIWYATGIFGK